MAQWTRGDPPGSDPVQQVIEAVSRDSLVRTVRELSGDTTVVIDGGDSRIISRKSRTEGNELARRYLAGRLASYGFSVELHGYDSAHPNSVNVIATQQGSVPSSPEVLICAHMDNIAAGDTVPGADDNASGTAVVLEAARILSPMSTDRTVVYALWNDEESGLVGSMAYAGRSRARGDSIVAVINVDMIGWDADDDGVAEVHANSDPRSIAIADTMNSLNTSYGIGLTPVFYNPGTVNSDHSSFWLYGYGAILLIEEYWGGDFNANYHTRNDRMQDFNLDFFHNSAKLAVGTVAALAGIARPSGVSASDLVPDAFALYQNYPNPFNPTTMVSFVISSASGGSLVTLKIYDVLGREVAILANEHLGPGTYVRVWNAIDFAGGVFYCRMVAGEFSDTKKLLLIR